MLSMQNYLWRNLQHSTQMSNFAKLQLPMRLTCKIPPKLYHPETNRMSPTQHPPPPPISLIHIYTQKHTRTCAHTHIHTHLHTHTHTHTHTQTDTTSSSSRKDLINIVQIGTCAGITVPIRTSSSWSLSFIISEQVPAQTLHKPQIHKDPSHL